MSALRGHRGDQADFLHALAHDRREHLLAVARANPGIVPVAKGNGYGFGIGRLARRAQWLDDQLRADVPPARVDQLAVGTYIELPEAAPRFDGDLLVVDRSVPPRLGHIVVALFDQELLIKRYALYRGTPHLCSSHPHYPPLPLEEAECQLWGVVRAVIHEYLP